MPFTAIDFETANGARASACSVGLCTIDNGTVVSCEEFLIRPEPLYFSPMNVSIHGITEADVSGSPTFGEIWDAMQARFIGPLVAHNASFDMSVLRRSLDQYKLPYPEIAYYCTRVMAKSHWPQLRRYGLHDLAQHVGIRFLHHHAAEDARACALLAWEMCCQQNVDSLAALQAPLAVTAGRLYPDGYQPCRGRAAQKKRRRRIDSHFVDAPCESMHSDTHYPFRGKCFVFTGAMQGVRRKDAMLSVQQRGGYCQNSVTQDTDVLVVGEKAYADLSSGKATTKVRKALQLQQAGIPLKIISESDFVAHMQTRYM